MSENFFTLYRKELQAVEKKLIACHNWNCYDRVNLIVDGNYMTLVAFTSAVRQNKNKRSTFFTYKISIQNMAAIKAKFSLTLRDFKNLLKKVQCQDILQITSIFDRSNKECLQIASPESQTPLLIIESIDVENELIKWDKDKANMLSGCFVKIKAQELKFIYQKGYFCVGGDSIVNYKRISNKEENFFYFIKVPGDNDYFKAVTSTNVTACKINCRFESNMTEKDKCIIIDEKMHDFLQSCNQDVTIYSNDKTVTAIGETFLISKESKKYECPDIQNVFKGKIKAKVGYYFNCKDLIKAMKSIEYKTGVILLQIENGNCKMQVEDQIRNIACYDISGDEDKTASAEIRLPYNDFLNIIQALQVQYQKAERICLSIENYKKYQKISEASYFCFIRDFDHEEIEYVTCLIR